MEQGVIEVDPRHTVRRMSGMKRGKKVRGYFGQGAKDALAGMDGGKICTFKNGQFVECKLFIELDDRFREGL
jgi:hypothetical protein